MHSSAIVGKRELAKYFPSLVRVVVLLSTPCLAADFSFVLKDGAISYRTETGVARSIRVGRKCTDLWVAPDGSAIAFVAIDKEQSAENDLLNYEQEPLIERSRLYVARKSNGFLPVLAASAPVTIEGRQWHVLRSPSLSPDGKQVYFSVPYTMTTSRIFVVDLRSGARQTLGDATDYCIVWNGDYSGSQLIQRRSLPQEATAGVTYQCYLRRRTGTIEKVTDSCDSFTAFVSAWVAQHGGTCTFSQQ